MDMIDRLQDKKDMKAHEYLKELELKSAECNELYEYFEEFLQLIHHKSSYVRTRGFRLCCAQAKWDRENKIDLHIEKLLMMLDDEKPTAVRQCLAALHLVVLYKPDLMPIIETRLNRMDVSKYKDSMRPLIEQDMEELRKLII